MTDEVNATAPQDPGWSNSPPNDGISSTEPPPGDRPMNEPGWSNDPVEPPPAPPITATGASAGTPGTWTPDGADPCAAFTQMDAITASPVTAWATGEYVVLGDASEAYWGGTAWTSGRAV
jgi:hypothetical protein